MVRDFEGQQIPLASLISFCTYYGAWLHGDERGSVNRKRNKYGTPRIAPSPDLEKAERKLLKHPPVMLDGYQRPVVEKVRINVPRDKSLVQTRQHNVFVERETRGESNRLCAHWSG